MLRDTLVQLWRDSWDGDIWIAPWSKALGGLTAAQAAWRPSIDGGPSRHSIWQNVNHLIFWRDNALNVLAGKPAATQTEIDAHQFAQPADITEAAWARMRDELARTHRQTLAAMENPAVPLDQLKYRLAHDAYHLGQIMYIRALLGLSSVM